MAGALVCVTAVDRVLRRNAHSPPRPSRVLQHHSLPTALSTAPHRGARRPGLISPCGLRPQANCARLALEFQGYIVRTRALRKVLTPYAYSSVLTCGLLALPEGRADFRCFLKRDVAGLYVGLHEVVCNPNRRCCCR